MSSRIKFRTRKIDYQKPLQIIIDSDNFLANELVEDVILSDNEDDNVWKKII